MEMKDAVRTLTALAQDSRLEVFRLLVRSGTEGLSAGTISEYLDIPPPTLSFHLTHLANAKLVEAHREGRSMIYTLKIEGIRELMAFLTEDCCQGRPELCSIAVSGLDRDTHLKIRSESEDTPA